MEPEKDIFEQWREERESRSWLRRKIDSFSLWWKHDGGYMHLEFIKGIKSVRYWLPIIWNDRNWDYHFIFTILSHKLKAQADYIGGRDIHSRSKRDAEVMMTCVRLTEKIVDEYYSCEYMDYHKEKHWFEPVEDNPEFSSWKTKELEDNFDDYFAKYPLIYKRVLNGEGWLKIEDKNDRKKIATNISHINHNRARKLLFKIMEENIERWWD